MINSIANAFMMYLRSSVCCKLTILLYEIYNGRWIRASQLDFLSYGWLVNHLWVSASSSSRTFLFLIYDLSTVSLIFQLVIFVGFCYSHDAHIENTPCPLIGKYQVVKKISGKWRSLCGKLNNSHKSSR